MSITAVSTASGAFKAGLIMILAMASFTACDTMTKLTAVMQAVPLLVIAFATLFLGETVGWRRVLAIITGLAGVLLIVKPSPASFTIYDGLSLGLIIAIA